MNKKKHHYVPKHLLRNFIENKYLYVYDKDNNSNFKSSETLDNVGCEKDYYSKIVNNSKDSNIFEDYLSDDIENPTVPIINKITTGNNITAREKLILSRYISILMKRVPKSKELLENLKSKTLNDVYKKCENLFNRYEYKNPHEKDIVDKKRIERDREIKKYKVNEIPQDIFLYTIKFDSKMINAIYRMKWKLLNIEEELSYFVTSDNPCFFFKDIGISNEDSELSFPISSKIALLATNKGIEGKYKAPKQFIKEINRRTIYSSARFIYSPKKEEWIEKVMKRKNPRLNQLILN